MLSTTSKSRHVVGFVYRPLNRPVAGPRQLSTVPQVFGPIDVPSFRKYAFNAEKPLILKAIGENFPAPLPALEKWFTTTSVGGHNETTTTPYLEQFSATWLPYELIIPPPSEPPISNPLTSFLTWLSSSKSSSHIALAALLRSQTETIPPETTFLRFEAPLALLLAALHFNHSRPSHHINLYIAQSPLPTLPPPLQTDLPPPALVTTSGRGDIYASSLWLGLEPTYTPWHRDPNPNFFCQLQSTKVVRLMPPRRGEELFRQARAKIGGVGKGARIRGEEMMQGEEGRVMREVVWERGGEGMWEGVVGRGDAMFIPRGWWHSLRSGRGEGGVNGSVNWWFR